MMLPEIKCLTICSTGEKESAEYAHFGGDPFSPHLQSCSGAQLTGSVSDMRTEGKTHGMDIYTQALFGMKKPVS